jgi:hypothetical protein
MGPGSLENWRKVKCALEAAGKTNTEIYRRACEVLRSNNRLSAPRPAQQQD